MKTKKDYEDLWQKARFNQEIIYKNISGKPIEEEKKSTFKGFAEGRSK